MSELFDVMHAVPPLHIHWSTKKSSVTEMKTECNHSPETK